MDLDKKPTCEYSLFKKKRALHLELRQVETGFKTTCPISAIADFSNSGLSEMYELSLTEEFYEISAIVRDEIKRREETSTKHLYNPPFNK